MHWWVGGGKVWAMVGGFGRAVGKLFRGEGADVGRFGLGRFIGAGHLAVARGCVRC